MKTACPMCGVDREHSEPHAGWCRIGKQERELQIWLAKSATKLREKLNMSKCVECGQPTGYHKVGCSENPTKISEDDGVLRSFNTGATRDTSEGKLEYHGFLSPSVIRQYAKFMNMNRLQSDGQLRDSNNWQKGIPMEVYQASEWRHHFEYWETVEKWMNRTVGESTRENEIEMVAAACGLIFNVMGFLHEYLKDRPEVDFDGTEPTPEMAERQRKLSHDKYVEVNGVYGEGCTHGEQCDYNMTGCADCQIPNSQRKCEPKH